MEQFEQNKMQTPTSSTAALLTRAFMFLEDGKWKKADEYFERILDMEPQNAFAYLGKLMVDLKVRKREELQSYPSLYDQNENYQKAVHFGDQALQEELTGYISRMRAQGVSDASKPAGKLSIALIIAAIVVCMVLVVVISTRKTPESTTVQTDAVTEQITEQEVPVETPVPTETEATTEYSEATTEAITIEDQYAAAVELMEAGEYDEAITAFEALDGFKDSAEKIAECNQQLQYDAAVLLLEEGKTVKAYEALIALEGYKDSAEKAASIYDLYKLKTAEIGDYVIFGQYEQDNNMSNGKEDIEWLVLDKQDGKLLVISRYGLDCQRYNAEYENITWEDCTLRTWLNDTFFYKAFSEEEQAMIPTMKVYAGNNPQYNVNPGYDTHDRAFVLSIGEANTYFSSDKARLCEPTEYAVANGAYRNRHGYCFWWLRSPGAHQYRAAGVTSSGEVYETGDYVLIDSGVDRPAMWIDISE